MTKSEAWSWAWAGPDAQGHHAQHHFRSSHATSFEGWRPPVDIYETDTDVVIYAAIPGIEPSTVTAVLDDGDVTISGRQAMPPDLRGASIHRLELPQGRFERRIELPPGRYEDISRSSSHGCLVLTVRKATAA